MAGGVVVAVGGQAKERRQAEKEKIGGERKETWVEGSNQGWTGDA